MSRPYTINPDDIRSQEFRGKMRGYDPVQVRSYLEEIADQVQGLHSEVRDLRKRLAAAEEAVARPGRAVSDAIDPARTALATSNAQSEAAAILQRAREEARNYEAEARRQLADLTRQVDELKVLRKRLITQIETLLNSQLEHLDRIKGDTDHDGDSAPEAPPVLAAALDDTQV